MTDPVPLTAEQERLKAGFVAARGYWRPWTEEMLRLDPGFLEAYGRYAGYPAAHGPLSPRMVELVYVALDCSATHMFVPGAGLHMKLALKAGATSREISDVLRLATAQGLGGCFAGMAILSEELGSYDRLQPARSGDEESAALKQRYERMFGDFPDHAAYLLARDKAFFATMLDVMEIKDGEGLDEREQAMIRVALAACFTGLDRIALRQGIRQCLGLGVDEAEIAQVFQLTAHLGVHACAVGYPQLREAEEATKEFEG